MHQSYLSEPAPLHLALEAERPRLVRLCTSWLGDPMAAEDVVQETLLEAWRKIETLRDPQAFRSWLTGIARNMSLRWLRRQGRLSAVVQPAPQSADILDNIPAAFDFELELERADLAYLLEEALDLLPAETRTILVQKYFEEASHQAIASQLGINENLVAVRIHRGKLALRKVMAEQLTTETEPFGLFPAGESWEETRIWCTSCGNRRLMGRLNEREFVLRCPDCHDEHNSFHSQSSQNSQVSLPFKTYRPALKHFTALMDDLFQSAIREGFAPCRVCGNPLPLRPTIAPYAPPSVRAQRGIHIYCPDCESGSYESLDGLALNLPQGRAFFQTHPRIHSLPQREIEFEGVPALVVAFAGVTDQSTYDVILTLDTYETLGIFSSDD